MIVTKKCIHFKSIGVFFSRNCSSLNICFCASYHKVLCGYLQYLQNTKCLYLIVLKLYLIVLKLQSCLGGTVNLVFSIVDREKFLKF